MIILNMKIGKVIGINIVISQMLWIKLMKDKYQISNIIIILIYKINIIIQ